MDQHSAFTVTIGLGSNLDNPLKQLLTACEALDAHPAIHNLITSSLYANEAIGPGEQPAYLNAVARFTTRLEPDDLLKELQLIEAKQGRVREIRWQARTLDLDILLIDQLSIQSPTLTVPHPEFRNRSFVVTPLLEIAPDLLLPSDESLKELADTLKLGETHPLIAVHLPYHSKVSI